MPHVVLKIATGRSPEEKLVIATKFAEALHTTFGIEGKYVSVAVEDVSVSDWMAKVYEPEIIGKPETLIRKPGYSPSDL